MPLSDDVLYTAWRAGETAAFESLFNRYEQRLLGFLVSLGGTREEAEEIAQNTWMKLLDPKTPYRARGRFRPWLFQIARRRLVHQQITAP